MTSSPLLTNSFVNDNSLIIPLDQQQTENAIQLLESWVNDNQENIQEQTETLTYLITGLDEDRLSDRKLFA